jgi:ABC-type transport system involved in multi-copper enzyme maturation permease subunit
MTRTLAIAGNTMREALRERLLYNLVIFAILLSVASLTISRLTLGEQFRIIADISTSSTQVFGILISVFVGVALVSREIDRRTAYAMLARPVSRADFILGKFLGLLATAGLNLVVMALASALVLFAYTGSASFLASGFFAAFGLMLAQFAVCVALAATAALLEPLGFPLTMFAALAFLLVALGQQSWFVTLAVAAAGSFGAFLLFDRWLRVTLPAGIFSF